MATPVTAAIPVTRKDAWKLSAISIWEPTLLWYAKAIGDMCTRPATDPTSWRFQAGVHGYNHNTDPLASAGPVPTKNVRDQFWKKCQHGSWFFLPWHRMYLGFFEQIVRATVANLGGPLDWALPYWNYSDSSNPQAKTLPPCFRQPTLPDGSPNPLFVILGVNIPRAPGINAGDPAAIPDQDVDLTGCLAETFFSPDTDTTSGDLGFGGPATGFNHDGQVFGPNSVESSPHNAIHVDVGGQWNAGGETVSGWMIDPDTAALDPIFWLHHANIDRLWTIWNAVSSSNTDPTGSVNVSGQPVSWPTSVPFSFNDANGNLVTMTPSQVLATAATSFNYNYEDSGNPLTQAAVTAVRRAIAVKPGLPEMIGANDKPVTLTGSIQTTSFAMLPPSGPGLTSNALRTEPAKTHLKVENVVSEKSMATYEVYVNLPDTPDAAAYQEHYAGVMHLFGVVQASAKSDSHAGNGLSFSMDITQLVNRLKAVNDWDERTIRVSFVPRSTGGTSTAVGAGHDPIRVGRVSLYMS